MKRGIFTIVLVFVVAMVIPVGAAETKELKIGVLGPMTGPVAFVGAIQKNAVLLAAEDVNAAGGVTVAGQRYKIKPIVYDTKYKVDVAKLAAERLLFEDKVKFILGGFSVDTRGFQAMTEKEKVIIFPGGGANFPDPKTPYTFILTANVGAKYKALYEYLKEKRPELKTIAFINPDGFQGSAYEKHALKAAEPLGYKVISSDFIARGSSDLTPVLTRILAKKPDILDLGGTGGASDSALIIKQAYELGYTGQIVLAIGLQSKTVKEVAGDKALEGVMETGYTADDPSLSPGFKKFAARWKKRFPKLPFIDLTSEYYDTTLGFFKFFDGQDTLDTEVLKDRLADYSWNGIYGKVFFGGEKTFGIKRQKIQPVYLSKWKGGKPVIVVKKQAFLP